MTNSIAVKKPRRYRIIKHATGCKSYPYKYMTQYRALGIWWNVDWSYDEESATGYIAMFHEKHFARQPLAKDQVIREIVL